MVNIAHIEWLDIYYLCIKCEPNWSINKRVMSIYNLVLFTAMVSILDPTEIDLYKL